MGIKEGRGLQTDRRFKCRRGHAELPNFPEASEAHPTGYLTGVCEMSYSHSSRAVSGGGDH